MNTNKLMALGIGMVVVVTLAVALKKAPPAPPEAPRPQSVPQPVAEVAKAAPLPPSPRAESSSQEPAPAEPQAPLELKRAQAEAAVGQAPPNLGPVQAQGPKAKEPIVDPEARAALSLVGADPLAEAYWLGAINDPSLPAEERKDLIEDLNEDGLSDPNHPGLQDLPLIISRLELIEELAPDAMDQVNADALAEAYKDLENMLSGKPVQ